MSTINRGDFSPQLHSFCDNNKVIIITGHKMGWFTKVNLINNCYKTVEKSLLLKSGCDEKTKMKY